MNINPNIRIVALPYHTSADIERHDRGFEHTIRMNHIYDLKGAGVHSHKRFQQALHRYRRGCKGQTHEYFGFVSTNPARPATSRFVRPEVVA